MVPSSNYIVDLGSLFFQIPLVKNTDYDINILFKLLQMFDSQI